LVLEISSYKILGFCEWRDSALKKEAVFSSQMLVPTYWMKLIKDRYLNINDKPRLIRINGGVIGVSEVKGSPERQKKKA
jgi:hypothetical protein